MDEKTKTHVAVAKRNLEMAIGKLERHARSHPENAAVIETVIEANLRAVEHALTAALE